MSNNKQQAAQDPELALKIATLEECTPLVAFEYNGEIWLGDRADAVARWRSHPGKHPRDFYCWLQDNRQRLFTEKELKQIYE